MGISFVGYASGANGATLPALGGGDLIIVFAFVASGSLTPSLPSGYTNLAVQNDATNGVSYRICYAVATGSETSVSLTNAPVTQVVVYRGALAIGASSASTHAASTTPAIPGLTLTGTNGNSWVVATLALAGHPSFSAPSGMTSRGSDVTVSGTGAVSDTNSGVSSWSGTSATSNS